MPDSATEPPFRDDRQRLRLADLADEIDAASEAADLLGWGSTGSKMRQTASSIRWQLRWDQKGLNRAR